MPWLFAQAWGFTKIQKFSKAVQGNLKLLITPGGERMGEKTAARGKGKIGWPTGRSLLLYESVLHRRGSAHCFPTSAALELGLILWGMRWKGGHSKGGR